MKLAPSSLRSATACRRCRRRSRTADAKLLPGLLGFRPGLLVFRHPGSTLVFPFRPSEEPAPSVTNQPSHADGRRVNTPFSGPRPTPPGPIGARSLAAATVMSQPFRLAQKSLVNAGGARRRGASRLWILSFLLLFPLSPQQRNHLRVSDCDVESSSRYPEKSGNVTWHIIEIPPTNMVH